MTNLFRRCLLTAALLVPLAAAGTASAGGFHVHVGGGAHFGGHWGGGSWGGGARWGGGWRGPHVSWGYRPTHVVVRGGIWVGGGYGGGYYDPYYYPGYATAPACDCGPSAYYSPVYPGPSTAMTPIAPPQAPLPTFGIGLYAGGTSTAGKPDANDTGLVANLRLTRGLLLQGELGKSEMADSSRVDKRFEGALVWEIGAENDWAPYLLAGAGVEGADTSDTSATQNFGEVGVGLRWALGSHLHITADIRAGSRATMDGGGAATPLTTTVAPPAANSGQNEDFTRMRIGAMLYF